MNKKNSILNLKMGGLMSVGNIFKIFKKEEKVEKKEVKKKFNHRQRIDGDLYYQWNRVWLLGEDIVVLIGIGNITCRWRYNS